MKNSQIKKYFYSKGILVGILSQNIFLLFFLIIISTKDGFDFLGLYPIWFIFVTFSICGILYFYLAQKEVSQNE